MHIFNQVDACDSKAIFKQHLYIPYSSLLTMQHHSCVACPNSMKDSMKDTDSTTHTWLGQKRSCVVYST